MADDAFSRAFGGLDTRKPAVAAPGDGIPTVTVRPQAAPVDDAFERAFKAPLAVVEPENVDPEAAASMAMMPAVNEVGRAAVEAYRGTPTVLTPAAHEAVSAGGPMGRYIVNPLLDAAGVGLAGMNALFAGVGRTIEGTATAAGAPGLGRDVNMGLQLLPSFGMGVPHPSAMAPPSVNPLRAELPRGPASTAEVYPPRAEPMSPAPAFVPPDAPLPPQRLAAEPAPPPPPPFMPINPLAADEGGTPLNAGNTLGVGPDGKPLPVKTGEASTGSTPTLTGEIDPQWIGGVQQSVSEILKANADIGGPTNLGAAVTPEQLAQMTPSQVKAYRRTAELDHLLSPPGREVDNTVYIDGVYPTEAERMANPEVAQRETLNRQRNPAAYTGEGGIITKNTDKLVSAFKTEAKTPIAIDDIDVAQKVQAQADTARILRTAKPADLQPALDHYNEILSNPRIQENPGIVRTITTLRDALYDADGQLKTDPQSVWGMHDRLMTMMDKAKNPLEASSDEKYSFSQLQGAKKVIDGVMNAATDGNFQGFLDNQSKFFQQKNALKVLQDFEPKLTNAKGNIMADRYHKWLVDLAVRRARPGIDPAMDIPDDVMQRLTAIDDHLKRSTNIDLGNPRGSPTNLYFALAQSLGYGAAHVAAAVVPGVSGWANFAIERAGPIMSSYRVRRDTNRALAPPEGGWPNALSFPPREGP